MKNDGNYLIKLEWNQLFCPKTHYYMLINVKVEQILTMPQTYKTLMHSYQKEPCEGYNRVFKLREK